MDWNVILTGLIGVVGVPLVTYLINLFMPRRAVYKLFRGVGAALRRLTFEKLGDSHAKKLLDVVCNTLTDIFDGLADGSRGIDKYGGSAKD